MTVLTSMQQLNVTTRKYSLYYIFNALTIANACVQAGSKRRFKLQILSQKSNQHIPLILDITVSHFAIVINVQSAFPPIVFYTIPVNRNKSF